MVKLREGDMHFLQKACEFKRLWQGRQGQQRAVGGITSDSGARTWGEADLEPVRALPRSTAWERKGMSLVTVVERSAREAGTGKGTRSSSCRNPGGALKSSRWVPTR